MSHIRHPHWSVRLKFHEVIISMTTSCGLFLKNELPTLTDYCYIEKLTMKIAISSFLQGTVCFRSTVLFLSPWEEYTIYSVLRSPFFNKITKLFAPLLKIAGFFVPLLKFTTIYIYIHMRQFCNLEELQLDPQFSQRIFLNGFALSWDKVLSGIS